MAEQKEEVEKKKELAAVVVVTVEKYQSWNIDS